MRLYGNDTCTKCISAKKILDDYGVSYVWVDVSDIVGFEGIIPQLVLDDGRVIVGLLRIKNCVVNLM